LRQKEGDACLKQTGICLALKPFKLLGPKAFLAGKGGSCCQSG